MKHTLMIYAHVVHDLLLTRNPVVVMFQEAWHSLLSVGLLRQKMELARTQAEIVEYKAQRLSRLIDDAQNQSLGQRLNQNR